MLRFHNDRLHNLRLLTLIVLLFYFTPNCNLSVNYHIFVFFFLKRDIKYISSLVTDNITETAPLMLKIFASNKPLYASLYLSYTTKSQLLTNPRKRPFENIVGKGENVGNQHFLLFPQCPLAF